MKIKESLKAMGKIKIVADENIQDVSRAFSKFGPVRLLPGRTIKPADLQGAEVLLVRSVTRVDRQLLQGTSIKFVGSATIGVDHIDQDYLAEQGITFAFAPGCNAEAVVQYVFSVIASTFENWQSKSVGIIGCGNVGGRLYRVFRSIGNQCRCYDPLLNSTQQPDLTSLDDVMQADIVTLHTPLTIEGRYPTWHLLDKQKLNRIEKGSLLINAGRGAVIDNSALLDILNTKDIHCALDVWENEPAISLPLLQRVSLATPHIAGYSLEGKLNGTKMLYQAFCRWLVEQQQPLLTESNPDIGFENYSSSSQTSVALQIDSINEAILLAYDVKRDDKLMRDTLLQSGKVESSGESTSELFDKLRKQYQARHEFNNFVINQDCPENTRDTLGKLGFTIAGDQ